MPTQRLTIRGLKAEVDALQVALQALAARLQALEDMPCACRPGRGQRATGGPQGR